MGVEVGGLLGLVWLVVVIWAIIQVVGSKVEPVAKLLWILALLFVPVIGLLCWLFLGPRS